MKLRALIEELNASTFVIEDRGPTASSPQGGKTIRYDAQMAEAYGDTELFELDLPKTSPDGTTCYHMSEWIADGSRDQYRILI
jgi:hypothetical protein